MPDRQWCGLGQAAAVAHGAAVVGPASIGEVGACPGAERSCPSFVGFNAVVDGAVVHRDAMVLSQARVAPGVTIPSGRKVMPGRFVENNRQVQAKTEFVTEADRVFMRDVIEVNIAFAEGYAALRAERPDLVRGINVNPQTTFNDRGLPTFHGVETSDPAFRNRIIGGVELADTKVALDAKMGRSVSMRGDEGEPLRVGEVTSVGSRHILHALKHTGMSLGSAGRYGIHSLVHGGGADGVSTVTGTNFRLGDLSGVLPLHRGRQRHDRAAEPGRRGHPRVLQFGPGLHGRRGRHHVQGRMVLAADARPAVRAVAGGLLTLALLATACTPDAGPPTVVEPAVDGLVATVRDDLRSLPGQRMAWTTIWKLCWAEYPSAIAYELQASTSEGTSTRPQRQNQRCYEIEAARGEHDVADWQAHRDVQLTLSSGQLAYRVRAILDGNRVSAWSPALAVGVGTQT